MNRGNVVVQSLGRRVAAGSVVFAVVLMTTVPSWAQGKVSAARELSNDFARVAKAAVPAVVSIKVEKVVQTNGGYGSFNDPYGQFGDDFLRRFFGGEMPRRQAPQKYAERAQGSGFIISEDGYILTNNHVVGDMDKITVELKDGRKFDNAKLIGTDPDSEVALIKIEGHGFPVLPMGDSKSIQIGDWVIAVGNPFGLSETVTVGVISAVGRNNVHIAAYEDFIQTDAAINPGNSGGPLIDLDGKAIGINTAIYSQSGGYMGIGFAIPINMARTIAEQLKESGKVSRGYLGLMAQDVEPEMAGPLGMKEPEGVVIAQIVKGSPADQAGLEVQDVILEVNGKKVESYDSFRNEIAALKPDSKVRLQVLHDGKTETLTATLGERPSGNEALEPATPDSKQAIGMEVQNLTRDLANQFGYELGQGVIVSSVVPGGPAADVGIQPGDLILSVNRQNVASVAEFSAALRQSRDSGKALLLVRRGDVSQFVIVNLQ